MNVQVHFRYSSSTRINDSVVKYELNFYSIEAIFPFRSALEKLCVTRSREFVFQYLFAVPVRVFRPLTIRLCAVPAGRSLNQLDTHVLVNYSRWFSSLLEFESKRLLVDRIIRTTKSTI